MSFDGPLWFVSSLIGCFFIFALLGRPILEFASTPLRNLFLAAAFSTMRTVCYFLTQPHSPVDALANSQALDGFMSSQHNYGWLLHYPPACALCFFAGAHTAALVKQLPSDSGIRTWRLWMIVDTLIVVLLVAGLAWSIGAKRSSTTYNRLTMRDGAVVSANEFHPFYCVFLFCTCCTHKGIICRFLSHPCVVVFAPLSYGAYCMHYDVLLLLRHRGWNTASAYSVCAYFTVTWLLGGLLVTFVENPCQQFLKGWKGELDRPSLEKAHETEPSETTPLQPDASQKV